MTASIFGLSIYAAWALGLLAFIGPGFARADQVAEVKKDLSAVQQQVASVQASLLAEKIDAVATSLCMERFDANLMSYRNTLQDQYRALVGHEHASPPCEILLKLKR